MMKTSLEDYRELTSRITPASRTLPNIGRAFIAGGAICVVGQLITEFWTTLLPDAESVSAATGVCLVLLGILLTALGLYDRLAAFGKAGTLVPITGFANSIASPALEFKSEGLISGLSAKMFVIAGPVLVYGVSTSSLFGLIYFVVALLWPA
jgi:stage V sporulation protein AC